MAVAYRIQPPATAFSLSPAGKGRRRPREENRDHLAWIRTLRCVITGRGGVEACHIRFADARFNKRETGAAEKPHDRWTLPMHPDKHREQHAMNERVFWNRYGLDPVAIAAALYIETGNDEAAAVILAQAWATVATMKVLP